MTAYEYKIGTSQAGMVLLSDLGIPAPKHGFVPFSQHTILSDASVDGDGWAQDEWYWGFITGSQRASLRTYVPGAGAHIYVRDLLDDGLTWHDFEVQAEWPENEERATGRFLGFSLRLRAMIQLEDLE